MVTILFAIFICWTRWDVFILFTNY